MRLTPRTIMGQFIAGTLLVQLLVITVFLAVSVRKQFNTTQQRDLLRLQRQTGIIAGLLAEPLTKDDSDLMDHVIHAVPIAASMKGARITDTQGNMLRNTSNELPMVLTAQERGLLPQLAEHPRYRSFTNAEGDLEGVQPVLSDGLVRGIVWVTQDSVVAYTTPTTVLESLLMYAPFALVGNLLLVWVLSGSMARPLRRLRRASQQVQLDPNDLSAFPLPAAENNEAGELTASVNAMVQEIALQRRGTQDTLNLLDSMLTGAPIGFGFYDRDFRYVRLNEHLAKMHGVPLEDHIGRRLRDLLPSASGVADQTERFVQHVFETAKPIPDDEIRGVLAGDAEERTFSASYFPVFASGDVRWVGVIATEVTERRRAEEAVHRSERIAAAGRLAASIAHDISNPLESLTNLMYLLRDGASSESLQYVGMAQAELSRISEITQSTLSFYRQTKAAADVRIDEILRSVVHLHGPRMQAVRIATHLQLDEETVLFGYASELRQMFSAMVSHAMEAMPAGGRLLIRAVQHRPTGVPGVRITVAYDGVAATKDKVDAPAETLLWMSEEILTRHRGTLKTRICNGTVPGTVFRVFLPLRGVPRGPFIVHSSTPVLVGR